MKPETLGEVHILFQNLNSRFDELLHKVEENTKITSQVLSQATLTNGRVNKIEPLAFDYQEKRANFRGMVVLSAVVGAGIITIGGFALNSYVDYKTGQITNRVIKEIDKTYYINYEKSNTNN